MNDRALTTKEIAAFLGISNQMVYNLIKSETLPAFKIGTAVRVLNSDLERYIERQKAVFIDENAQHAVGEANQCTIHNLTSHIGAFSIGRLSFAFPINSTVVIVGGSGSGKSLLLKTIAGLIDLDSGSIFFGEGRLDTVPVGKRRVGYMFQDESLMPHLNAHQNIGFPQMLRGLTKEQIDQEVAAIVGELQIPAPFLTKLPAMLPGGIKQLVALGRAWSNAIDLYIMDEPLAHLDAFQKKELRVFFKRLVQQLGKTTFLALNDPEDALALGDYVVIMDKGNLVQFGPIREVYEHPVSPASFETMSVHGALRIPVVVAKGETQPLGLEVREADGSYELYFRPQDLRVVERGSPGALDVKIVGRHFFDGRLIQADCVVDGAGAEPLTVKLLVPPDVPEICAIQLTNPRLFPI